jgi:anti-sigma factor RsiW
VLSCDDVRPLLPAYAERAVHEAGDLEVHLASCAGCRAELAAYRSLLGSLAELRDVGPPAPAGFEARVLARVPLPSLRGRVRTSLREHPEWVALASIGGAALGATAIGVVALARRRRHRIAVGAAP